MIRLFRQVFGPTQQEVIDAVFAKCAESEAEASKHAALVAMYDNLLRKIDPQTDWWSFAAAKQAQADASANYAAAVNLLARQRQQADALIESYKGIGQ